MESQSVDIDSVCSQIDELRNFLENSGDISAYSSSESDNLLQDFVLDFETKVNQIVSEHSDVGSFQDEDLGAYMDRLRVELRMTEAESASICNEIEGLTKSCMEGTCKLESNLESLHHAMHSVKSKGLKHGKAEQAENSKDGDIRLSKEHDDSHFQILNLKHQTETNRLALKTLQDLDLKLKRLEAIEKIEEALTGLKVIDFERNHIRVSLRTCIPVEDLLYHLKGENEVKPHEVSHELLIEVMDESLELKNVEIFPNDMYIREIIDAANRFSKLFSQLSVLETRSSLGWFLQKVQDRIVTCTTRQLIVKCANNSRHSFEYVDKEELIIGHLDGGVDIFLKPSQGWPLSMSVLKLVSLRRSSGQNAKELSLSLLCKVEEAANSLDVNTRKSITDFADRIEEILLENMRAEPH